MYELIVGIPPYYDNNRKTLFDNILSGPLRIPHTMSHEARDLVVNLLNRNPKKRLGSGPDDADPIKLHKFFEGINWDDVENLKLKMPKINVPKDIPQNNKAEQDFKNGEIKSEIDFKLFMKKNNIDTAKLKDQESIEFSKDP